MPEHSAAAAHCRLSAAALQAWRHGPLGGADLPRSDDLLSTAVEDFVSAGELLADGLHNTSTLLVVGGVARVLRRSLGPHGVDRQVTISYRSSGQFIGLPSALAPHLVPAMQSQAVQALTDVHVLRISPEALLGYVESDPAVARVMIEELVATLLEAHDLLAENIFLPVRRRVARHVLDLALNQDGVLTVRATQQDVANAIGSVREVVSRAVARFCDDGLLRRAGGGYILVDPAALHRVAAGLD